MNSGHFRNECIHGRVYSQCRCAGPNKTVNRVPCPADAWHRELALIGPAPTMTVDESVWIRVVDHEQAMDDLRKANTALRERIVRVLRRRPAVGWSARSSYRNGWVDAMDEVGRELDS